MSLRAAQLGDLPPLVSQSWLAEHRAPLKISALTDPCTAKKQKNVGGRRRFCQRPFFLSYSGRYINHGMASAGNAVEATLETPDGYTPTVYSALAAVARVLAGNVTAGFSTPSKAFGIELVLTLPDTVMARTPAAGNL